VVVSLLTQLILAHWTYCVIVVVVGFVAPRTQMHLITSEDDLADLLELKRRVEDDVSGTHNTPLHTASTPQSLYTADLT